MPDRTPIVTVFLTHKGKVLLLKRSELVGSYQGKWAGVSGYLERLPLDQARLEVLEEAGLHTEDIKLRGIGVPYPVDDDELDNHWLVYPFLFEIDDPYLIQTDWEASEIQWIEPIDMLSFDTVPGLKHVFDLVWPPFGSDDFWNELARIATGTTSGSTDLVLAGLSAIILSSDEDSRRSILAFSACRPSMGAFPNLAFQLINALDLGEDFRKKVDELSSYVSKSIEKAAINASKRLKGARKVFTISRSRVVQRAIELWAAEVERPEVVIAESRPDNEGIGLAEALADKGIRVTFITDAQMANFIPLCDAVVVGCDAITPYGEIVNKSGTRLAVLVSRACGIPSFAIAQSFKMAPRGWPKINEEQDPDQVYKSTSLHVRNLIFDRTPMQEFTAVISEQGDLVLS